jgi:hypothetical protein
MSQQNYRAIAQPQATWHGLAVCVLTVNLPLRGHETSRDLEVRSG